MLIYIHTHLIISLFFPHYFMYSTAFSEFNLFSSDHELNVPISHNS